MWRKRAPLQRMSKEKEGKKKTNRRSSACGYATKGTAKRVEEKFSTHLTMEGARAL